MRKSEANLKMVIIVTSIITFTQQGPIIMIGTIIELTTEALVLIDMYM